MRRAGRSSRRMRSARISTARASASRSPAPSDRWSTGPGAGCCKNVNMQPRGQRRNRRGDFDSHRGRDDNRLKDRGKQTQLLDGGERNQRACIRNDGHSEGPAVFDFSTKIFLAQLQVWNAPRRGMTNEVAARPPTRDCTPVNSIDHPGLFPPAAGLGAPRSNPLSWRKI